MTGPNALTPLSDTDYVSIEHAVMETERGRWFLAEYARRNRNSDTEVLLDAINRLEGLVSPERGAKGLDQLRVDLLEMSKAISRTKNEISAIIPQGNPEHLSRLGEASGVLDGIVKATEKATQDILECAEHTQEVAWTLRENGAQEELCDALDRHATNIYTACSFQDITSQRIVKVVHVMRYLEDRINAMIAIWDKPQGDQSTGAQTSATPVYVPQQLVDISEFSNLSQNDVDGVIIDDGGMFKQADTQIDASEAYSFEIDAPVDVEQEAHTSHHVSAFGTPSDMDVYVASVDEIDVSDLSHLDGFEHENQALDSEQAVQDNQAYFVDSHQLYTAIAHVHHDEFELSKLDTVYVDALALAAPHEKSDYFDEELSNNVLEQQSQNEIISLDDVRQMPKASANSFEEFNSLDLITVEDAELQPETQENIQELLEDALTSNNDVCFDNHDAPHNGSGLQSHHAHENVTPSHASQHTIAAEQGYPYAHDAATMHDTATMIDTSIDEQAFIQDTLQDTLEDVPNHENADEALAFDLDSIDLDAVAFATVNPQSEENDPQSPPIDARKAAFADLDKLDTHEKLSRFS